MIGAIAVGLDLPMLAREIAVACHLEQTGAVDAVVVDDFEGVGLGLVCVLETVPFLGIEVASWGLADGLDSNVKRHGSSGLRNTRHGDVCIASRIRLAIRVGCSIERGVV